MRVKEYRAQRYPPFFLLCAFVAVLLDRSKPNFGWADYSACVVYTKTIIHLRIGESGRYLPPLRWIIVTYSGILATLWACSLPKCLQGSKILFEIVEGLITHQMFLFAHEWSKRVWWLNISQLDWGNIRVIVANFKMLPCCQKYLKA